MPNATPSQPLDPKSDSNPPPPFPPSNGPQQSPTMNGVESFAGSAGQSDFAAPVGDDISAAIGLTGDTGPQPKPQANPEVTVALVVGVCQTAASTFAWPLSDAEQAELHRDLLPVLRKYNVPNLPMAEELALAVTLGKLGLPRVIFAVAGGDDDAGSGSGKEAKRQDRGSAETGLPATNAAVAAVDSIL